MTVFVGGSSSAHAEPTNTTTAKIVRIVNLTGV